MAMTPAERVRRHRDRESLGFISLTIDVPEVELVELLVATGHLQEPTEDHTAIARALEAWLIEATSPDQFENVTTLRRELLKSGTIRP